MCGRVGEKCFFITENVIVNYNASGLSTVKIQRTISLLRSRNFIHWHKQSLWTITGTARFFYSVKKKRSISFICLHNKILPLIYIIIILLGVQTVRVHRIKATTHGSIFVNLTAFFDACVRFRVLFWNVNFVFEHI